MATEQQRHVDPFVEIALPEMAVAGLVKVIRPENNRPICAMRDAGQAGIRAVQEIPRQGFITIVQSHIFPGRHGNIPNVHAAGLRIEIGLIGRNIEIDIHCGIVGMGVCPGRQCAVIFERPKIMKMMGPQDVREGHG